MPLNKRKEPPNHEDNENSKKLKPTRMDMIAELPEPVLPHLCSFFTIKVNEVMAQVSKKWKRVADIYGCFEFRLLQNVSMQNITAALQENDRVSIQTRLFRVLYAKVAEASKSVETARVRSNLKRIQKALVELRLPKDVHVHEAQLLRSLLDSLSALHIRKVIKDLPFAQCSPYGEIDQELEQSTILCKLDRLELEIKVVIRGGHGANKGTKRENLFRCSVGIGGFYSDFFEDIDSDDEDEDEDEDDGDDSTKVQGNLFAQMWTTRKQFRHNCSKRLMYYFLKCVVLAVEETDSLQKWRSKEYKSTPTEKNISKVLAALATVKERRIYFSTRHNAHYQDDHRHLCTCFFGFGEELIPFEF